MRDHAGGFPVAGQHDFRGGRAARRQFGREPDPATVRRHARLDAGGVGGGALQAICSAGSLRALRRAYVALRREQPDAGRRGVREAIRVIRFAIRALARGSEFQPADGERVGRAGA